MLARAAHIEFKELESNKLQLVKLDHSHADDLFKFFYDYDVMRLTDSNLHFKIDDTHTMIDEMSNRQSAGDELCWGIKVKPHDQVVGIIRIYHIDKKHHFASIGCILSKNYWRLGYMTEAIKLIVKYCFTSLNLNRIEAQMFVGHDASVNLFEKLRFTREAVLRENFQIEWKFESSYVYSLIKSDYLKLIDFFKVE